MKQVRVISLGIAVALIGFFACVFISFQATESTTCQAELTSDEVRTLRTKIADDISNAKTKQLIFRLSASELNALLLPSLIEQGFTSCISISDERLNVLLTQNPLIWFTAKATHFAQEPFLTIEQLFLWFIPLPSSFTKGANEQLASGFMRFKETSGSDSAWTITNIEVTDNSVFITLSNGR